MAEDFDRERLEALLAAMAERLHGDWLLVGGALAALWLDEPGRTTEDVDLIGLSGAPEERLALMQLAQEMGLPIEAVNSAADFFVRRISGWEEEIEIFRTGPKTRIYRPTPTLFLLLKLDRLSEQDLGDCLATIDKARGSGLRCKRYRSTVRITHRPSARAALVRTPSAGAGAAALAGMLLSDGNPLKIIAGAALSTLPSAALSTFLDQSVEAQERGSYPLIAFSVTQGLFTSAFSQDR